MQAFRNTLNNLMAAYPSTIDDDLELLRKHHADIGIPLTTTMVGAVSIRLR